MPKLTLPSGHAWAFVDANPQGKTTILCLHGFPDLGYGYRHQIGPWARAGFRVVVPDMLGYGGSDAPIDPLQYTTKRLAGDLMALLTALGVGRAIVVGHDWGSFTAGRVALWHPDRVLALVLMSVPYTPPARAPMSLNIIAERAPNLGYQLFLASPEAAPTLEENIPYFLTLTFSPPSQRTDFTPKGVMKSLLLSPLASIPSMPCLLKGDAHRAYLNSFRARGLTGATNYYRTAHLRYVEESIASLPSTLPSTLPVLSIYGTLDATIAPAALKAQRRFVPRLTEVPLKGAGHWVMIEDVPDEESPSFVGEGADPLGGWREQMSAGAWKGRSGDGGAVGREVLSWLKGLDVAEVRGKL
ncbi:epoxide hydrolase [Mycena alexandri]|uniref:Epoxide hydrolase n=1 Tax=Mycena alexandri TaxID=1745969 RepID=A0AAD6TDU8_9AGAR|nr:epoxide hydrolase [Mycena alexandri]